MSARRRASRKQAPPAPAPPAAAEPRPSASSIAHELAGIGGHLIGIEHQLRELGFNAKGPDGEAESWLWAVLMDALGHEQAHIEQLEGEVRCLGHATAPTPRQGAA
jgi:hypothetical protein